MALTGLRAGEPASLGWLQALLHRQVSLHGPCPTISATSCATGGHLPAVAQHPGALQQTAPHGMCCQRHRTAPDNLQKCWLRAASQRHDGLEILHKNSCFITPLHSLLNSLSHRRAPLPCCFPLPR